MVSRKENDPVCHEVGRDEEQGPARGGAAKRRRVRGEEILVKAADSVASLIPLNGKNRQILGFYII
jgi:hypothetical protein